MTWRWPWEREEEPSMNALVRDPKMKEIYVERDKNQAAILRAQRLIRTLDARAELIRDGRMASIENRLTDLERDPE